MSAPHLILCGGARLSSKSKAWSSAHKVALTIGKGPNAVHLGTEDIPARLYEPLSDRALDLLEIAAFVFTADQAASRGGEHSFEYGEAWRRHFRFQIPVRDVEFWGSAAVTSQLVDALGFLSDDDYEFAFSHNRKPARSDAYLPFAGETSGSDRIEEVMLFSGGLDSLAGAVQEVVVGQRRVALVSHVSSTKIGKPQRELVAALRQRSSSVSRAPLHVPVRLNKGKSLGIDNAQRTRSFVFSSIAGVVARGLGLNRIRFYENGPISFNFPIAGELVGGRASRTTHPRSVMLLGRLLKSVFGPSFEIENPFLWSTRGDIIEQLRTAGLSSLCAKTISCARTKERTTQHPHCGRCSQCLDRRIAALAVDLSDDDDPSMAYASSFDTPCRDAPHRTLVERYVGNALRLGAISSAEEFRTSVPEVARVLSALPRSSDGALERVFQLHKRYAEQIRAALVRLVRREAPRIIDGRVPADSPLGIILRLGPSLGEISPASSLPTPSVSTEPSQFTAAPTANSETFEVCYRNGRCFLGNTKEFWFFERLARQTDRYVSLDQLRADVWDGDVRATNTIHKCASVLRRRLRENGGFDGLLIDGDQKGCYAMKNSASGKG